MRVLVTGASGWVGSHVVRSLASDGHEVLALGRRRETLARLQRSSTSITTVDGDLDSPEEWNRDVLDFAPESSVHCAWHVDPVNYLDSHLNIRSLEASLYLMSALATAGCSRAVYVGTCAEYDANIGYLRETSPTRPATLYAASKLALSVAASRLAEGAGIDFVWARLFHVFGPEEDRRRMVPALILSLLERRAFPATDGRQVRDYLHVHDVAAALATLAVRGRPGEYNVCSGAPVQVRSLMQVVGDIIGQSHLIRFGEASPKPWDPPFVCGDPTKLSSETGWQAGHSLLSGLQSSVDWWRSIGSAVELG
jgi:nucleoside-diphosphate-sugar epimerase